MSDFKKDADIHLKTEGSSSRKATYDPSKHLGYLGEFFGGVENAPTSISGVIVLFLIFVGIPITFYRPEFAMEYWKSIVLPTVTALFGYLFGKRQK